MDMTDLPRAGLPDSDAEQVLGATLCMLSCALSSGSPYHLARITANLEWLAASPAIGADLRLACRRLGQHWDGVCAQMDMPSDLPSNAHAH